MTCKLKYPPNSTIQKHFENLLRLLPKRHRQQQLPVFSKVGDIFIRQALVEGLYETRAPFFAHNKRLVREIEEIENKTRRPDVLVDDETIYAFYDKILDASVVGGSTFEKWRRVAEKENPKVLFMKRDDLMRHDASGVTVQWYPKTYRAAGIEMALTYHFEPGSPRDGVTLAVPIFGIPTEDSQTVRPFTTEK